MSRRAPGLGVDLNLGALAKYHLPDQDQRQSKGKAEIVLLVAAPVFMRPRQASPVLI